MRAFAPIAAALLWSNASSAQVLAKDAEAEDSGGDESGEAEDGEPRIPWRGTGLKWSQSATTSAVGVGQNFQSSAGFVYTHGYWALLNYYIVEEENVGSIRLHSSPGFDVEITDSAATSHIREPQPRDLNLSASGRWIAFQDSRSHQSLDIWPSATVLLPTSEISRDTGTYFVTSPRLLLTYEAPFIPGVGYPSTLILGAALRWDHRFTSATEPVSAEVQARVARLTTAGDVRPSSNLTGTPQAHDTVTVQGVVYYAGEALGQPFFLSIGSAYTRQFLFSFAEVDCILVNGACVDVTSNEDILGGDASRTRDIIQFDVVLEHWVLPELAWQVGYVNSATVFGPDGLRRSPFYSPGAAFTTQIILSIDAIYESLTGPRRKVAFFLPG